MPQRTRGLNHIINASASAWGAEPTPLVGRARALAHARRLLLDPEVRLLTLVGPPGVGKTRLASALVESVSDTFADGVHRIDFACAEDPAAVPIAHGQSIRTLDTGGTVQGLAAALAHQSGLLVVDHVEHEPAAALQLAQLLKTSASLKILVSGRHRLQLQWEHVLRVGPLELPADLTDPVAVAASPAVQLYLHRASAVDASFDLTAENFSSIAELCMRLDGLPLAMELAALRVRIMQPAVLLEQLQHRLDILVGGPGDLPLRQRSMRTAFDGSTAGLSTEEQLLFARLSVLERGWTVEAARALDGQASSPKNQAPLHVTVGRLESLVDRSLIYHVPGRDGQARFSMLETLRAYAHERLMATGELSTTRARWIDYYADLVQRECHALRGSGQTSALANLDAEYVNITRVLGECVETDNSAALHLVGNLSTYWTARGDFAQAQIWLDRVLSMQCAADPNNARILAVLLRATADAASARGEYARAEEFLKHSCDAASAVSDTVTMLAAQIGLARIWYQRGETGKALRDLTGTLAKARETADEELIAEAQHALGDLRVDEGQFALAQAHLEQSLEHWHSLGDELRAASVLESIAVLMYRQGDSARSLRLLGSVNSIAERVGVGFGLVTQSAHFRERVHEVREVARMTLGEELAQRAEEHGRSLRTESAVGYARTSGNRHLVEPLPPPATGNGGRLLPTPQSAVLDALTPRERDVAMLVLRGMSNRQIGAELGISERTAETHVCRILGKLDLDSRAQMPALIIDDGASAPIVADADEVARLA